VTRSPAGRSRAHARALRERLRREYGEFRERTVRRERSAAAYEDLCDRLRSTGRVGAVGAWIRDDEGRVLLVHEVAREGVDPGWTDPGGRVEPGERYEEAARREAREEAGVTPTVTGVVELLRIEHHPPDGRDPVVVPTPVFAADHAGGDPRPEPGETDDVGWFRSPPEAVRYAAVRDRPFPET
jgi:ADP-ribose pyrophosphatase YjhB (NUDIX family)